MDIVYTVEPLYMYKDTPDLSKKDIFSQPNYHSCVH